MKLLIGVATYRRIGKLNRLLKSLNEQNHGNLDIYIVADNADSETVQFISRNKSDDIKIGVQDSHKYVIGAWNRVIQENISREWDGFIGLCDDVELLPNTLEKAVLLHNQKFFDTDGVVGFAQDCPGYPRYTFKWFGQTLIGRKFVERYRDANYQICCPDYYHFVQDEEMHEYASSLGKFINCPEALLHHYHPSFIESEHDETHDIIRTGPTSPKSRDFEMQTERRRLGYLWGRDFNLVGKKPL